jgi:integrase
MARKSPGLHKRGQVWWIDKAIYGVRLRCSTGTGNLEIAEQILARKIEEVRQVEVFGAVEERTFAEAAARYLMENEHRRAIVREAYALALVMPYIGDLPLSQVHEGTLETFINDRLKTVSPGTVNRDLTPVKRVLNLSARLWRHKGNGKPWLSVTPLIRLREYEARQPHILTWDEQRRLFAALPSHLAAMATFKVNTGTREREVVNLRWEWEIRGHHAFLIPAGYVKNELDRLVVCNSVAWSVIESVRGEHPERVFTYNERPVTKMYNSGWKSARKRVGLPNVRVHDLKHTFGFRLRAAGVDATDRKDLLGHKSSDISRHYSAPDIEGLLEAAEKVVGTRRDPALRIVGERQSGSDLEHCVPQIPHRSLLVRPTIGARR